MSLRKGYKSIEVGKTYNRITVIEDLGQINGTRFILGKCVCGVEKKFNWANVKFGKSKSCGCLPIEINTRHGLHGHLLYSVWEGMIGRCYCVTHPKYYRYGGRGVTMCEQWKNDFVPFYEWAIKNGYKKGLSLDKDKLAPGERGFLYCPEYCCFLTRKENSMYRESSRMITYKGETMCVAQFADKFGIKYPTFQARLQKGWSVEDIIETPIKYYKKRAA